MPKVERIKVSVLAKLVSQFLEVACPQMACVITMDGEPQHVDDDGEFIPTYLNIKDTLAMWLQLPDCSYTPMFVGWLIGQGVTLDSFSPEDIDKAVCVALTGSEKNVMFDWLGDVDASQKPN